MQWLVYEVFLFIGAFQAIKGFPSNIFFNTSAFGVHPSSYYMYHIAPKWVY